MNRKPAAVLAAEALALQLQLWDTVTELETAIDLPSHLRGRQWYAEEAIRRIASTTSTPEDITPAKAKAVLDQMKEVK